MIARLTIEAFDHHLASLDLRFHGTDMPDCIALAPTAEELAECLPWLELQDGNELWPDHVRATMAGLGRRFGHGV